tara:strand:+ start:480 stop:653 length:174 start_codon:yes stop_codon:yes gene_type:complete
MSIIDFIFTEKYYIEPFKYYHEILLILLRENFIQFIEQLNILVKYSCKIVKKDLNFE